MAAHRARDGIGLVPSRYNTLIPLREGAVLAHNGMLGSLAVWDDEDRETYDQIVAGLPYDAHGESVRALIAGGFVVPRADDERRRLEEQYRFARFDRGALTLTVAPTMACNFACDYCFQSHDRSVGVMGEEVRAALVALLDRFARGIRRMHVAWYGGEPLLATEAIFDLSRRFSARCRVARVTYDAMMVTNGHLLTPELAAGLFEHGVRTIQVTLDGPREAHDQRRVLRSGGATFDRIVANLAGAVETYQGAITARVNIDHRNHERIHVLFDQLAEAGLAGKKNFKIYFAPVEAITQACHAVVGASMGKLEYARLEASLVAEAARRGLTGAPYPLRFRSTCAAVRPLGFVVLPQGELFKCWDTVDLPETSVGSLFDLEAALAHPTYRAWLDWDPFASEGCRDCNLLPSCMGGCAYKFLYQRDTRGEGAVLPCISWKYNINERLLIMALAKGSITAQDFDLEQVRTSVATVSPGAVLGTRDEVQGAG
ncbi:MAG: radical SAM protein [Pseudomonadota bacterium]